MKKLKGERYLKEILFLNSFSLEDKDPRFTRLKPDLAIRLLSKGLFYIRAMPEARVNPYSVEVFLVIKSLAIQGNSYAVETKVRNNWVFFLLSFPQNERKMY